MSVTAVPLQPTPRRILVMLWVGILAAIAIAVGLAFAAPSNPVSGFLATNAHEDGVVQTASGLQYKVLEPGKRSEEHTSELQSLMRISYAVFCLKKKNQKLEGVR